MSKKHKTFVEVAAGEALVETMVEPQAVPAASDGGFLVLGPKAPRHRVGHNGAAWAAITPLLPASPAACATACAVVPNIGGPKGNGMLFVSYAIRRGWLVKQA